MACLLGFCRAYSFEPTDTIEMCMTGLDREKASVFYKTGDSSAALMTTKFGIRKILPKYDICDFEFDPCGYSINSIKEGALSTIHVTPEDCFSYVSFEAARYDMKVLNLDDLLERPLACFQPKEFFVAVRAGDFVQSVERTCAMSLKVYSVDHKSCEELADGSCIIYQTITKAYASGSPRSTLKGCWKEESELEEEKE